MDKSSLVNIFTTKKMGKVKFNMKMELLFKEILKMIEPMGLEKWPAKIIRMKVTLLMEWKAEKVNLFVRI